MTRLTHGPNWLTCETFFSITIKIGHRIRNLSYLIMEFGRHAPWDILIECIALIIMVIIIYMCINDRGSWLYAEKNAEQWTQYLQLGKYHANNVKAGPSFRFLTPSQLPAWRLRRCPLPLWWRGIDRTHRIIISIVWTWDASLCHGNWWWGWWGWWNLLLGLWALLWLLLRLNWRFKRDLPSGKIIIAAWHVRSIARETSLMRQWMSWIALRMILGPRWRKQRRGWDGATRRGLS